MSTYTLLPGVPLARSPVPPVGRVAVARLAALAPHFEYYADRGYFCWVCTTAIVPVGALFDVWLKQMTAEAAATLNRTGTFLQYSGHPVRFITEAQLLAFVKLGVCVLLPICVCPTFGVVNGAESAGAVEGLVVGMIADAQPGGIMGDGRRFLNRKRNATGGSGLHKSKAFGVKGETNHGMNFTTVALFLDAAAADQVLSSGLPLVSAPFFQPLARGAAAAAQRAAAAAAPELADLGQLFVNVPALVGGVPPTAALALKAMKEFVFNLNDFQHFQPVLGETGIGPGLRGFVERQLAHGYPAYVVVAQPSLAVQPATLAIWSEATLADNRAELAKTSALTKLRTATALANARLRLKSLVRDKLRKTVGDYAPWQQSAADELGIVPRRQRARGSAGSSLT